MGVLNVTPDSFSDGGRVPRPGGGDRPGPSRWSAEGAAVVDVGGESTRPGAEPVDETEELPGCSRSSRRPRVRGAGRRSTPAKPEVARAAVAAGADPHQRRLGVAARGRRRDRRRLGRHAHAGHARRRCRTRRTTTTSWPRCAEFLDDRARTAPRRRGRARSGSTRASGSARPARTTSRSSRHLDRAGRPGPPGRGRDQPQGLPRRRARPRPTPAAGRPGRRPVDDRLEGSVATATVPADASRAPRMVRAHDVLATAQAAQVVAACSAPRPRPSAASRQAASGR